MNAPFSLPVQDETSWTDAKKDALLWLGRCLQQFALIEHEVALTLNVVGHAGEADATKRQSALASALGKSANKECKKLGALLSDWGKRKALRNMLAHGTIHILQSENGARQLVVRHVATNPGYDFSDRMWSMDERDRYLHDLRADAQAICDRFRNLKADESVIKALKI